MSWNPEKKTSVPNGDLKGFITIEIPKGPQINGFRLLEPGHVPLCIRLGRQQKGTQMTTHPKDCLIVFPGFPWARGPRDFQLQPNHAMELKAWRRLNKAGLQTVSAAYYYGIGQKEPGAPNIPLNLDGFSRFHVASSAPCKNQKALEEGVGLISWGTTGTTALLVQNCPQCIWQASSGSFDKRNDSVCRNCAEF